MPIYQFSRQRADIIFKSQAQALVSALPRHLGLDLPPIRAMLPTEQPRIDIRMQDLDIVFELEDGSILHLEFQTTARRSYLDWDSDFSIRL